MQDRFRDLLGWFDRDRDEIAATPEPVTRANAAAAMERLSKRLGIDFEDYHESQRGLDFMKEPLGDQPDCLSPAELSAVLASRSLEPLRPVEPILLRRVLEHLESCGECWEMLELHQEIEQAAALKAARDPILEESLWLDPVAHIKDLPSPTLSLSLTAADPTFLESGSTELQLCVQIEDQFVPLHVSRWVSGLVEPSPSLFRHFTHLVPWKSLEPVRFGTASCEIEAVEEPGVLEPGALRYVALARRIGSREIFASRIVRFETRKAWGGGG